MTAEEERPVADDGQTVVTRVWLIACACHHWWRLFGPRPPYVVAERRKPLACAVCGAWTHLVAVTELDPVTTAEARR